jgi:hypothetical protein
MLDSGDFIFLIDMNHGRAEICGIVFRHLAVGKNNNDITLADQPRGSSVQADLPAAGFALYGISRKARTVIDVQDMHLFVGQDVGYLHQVAVNSNAALIVDIEVGNTGAVDFAFHHCSHQFTTPVHAVNI